MWNFKGKELSDDQIPDKAIGFIYRITQISNGKQYLGKKLLTKSATKSVKGVKKKIRVESDWRDYWSSSPALLDYITSHGLDDFTKEILVFCSSKGSLLYCEELALYAVGALESDQWWNSNIRSKVYRSWVRPTEAKELRETLSYHSSSGSS